MRRVRVGTNARIRKCHAILHRNHRRHPLQIDLMHDAVARWNHIDVPEGLLGPIDEVEAIIVTTILDGAIAGESVPLEAAMLHRQ
ncbi:MAG: hypothetical protein BWZ07_02363 [Alphaproteobacteria bacterium ADurb.BinA280]|nr:MAG: hypothetical protein BWZ07_02363 [Alphaproteobacteria bacterium ADurb.BinA280]